MVEDGETRDAGEVAQHVMELEVHLGDRLLHVLGVGGRQLDEAVAMAQEGPHGADRVGRAEGGAEEPHRVEGPGATGSPARRSCAPGRA